MCEAGRSEGAGRVIDPPIVFVTVKTRGDSNNIGIPRTLEVSPEGFHEFLTMISLRVKASDRRRATEDIKACRSFSKMSLRS